MPSICVEYYGDVYAIWRRSNLLESKLVVKHKDGYGTGNWSSFKDIPNTDIDCVTPTISYGDKVGGIGNLHVFWVDTDTQPDRVYYANPDAEWNWGTSTDVSTEASEYNIDNFKNTSVHQPSGTNLEGIFLVWEGIEQFAGETKNTKSSSKLKLPSDSNSAKTLSSGCPPVSTDNPVIYFREKTPWGWDRDTFFRINNTCDKKPVVTSWENGPNDRLVMIAYESSQGKISTILRNESFQWASPTLVTNNGANPALTNPDDSEPNLIYTRNSTDPHEIRFDDDLLPPPSAPGLTNPSFSSLPHSRIVQFNLEQDLLGGTALGIKGEVAFEIGDLEVISPEGSQRIIPEFKDTLITPNNVFEFEDLAILEENSSLRIPIVITAPELSYSSNRDSIPIPLFHLRLRDAVTHAVVKEVRYYDTNIFGNNTSYQEHDTIEVSLNNLLTSNLYFRGEIPLNDNTWKIGMAEIYDLRNIEPDTLQKGIIEDEDPNIPKKYALYQNFPNPFNPSTTIRFDLPKSTSVKIKIYDIQGRLVNVLVDEKMKAGSHEVVWDGRSHTAYKVSSGVYFYRIQAAGFTKVKKMLIVK